MSILDQLDNLYYTNVQNSIPNQMMIKFDSFVSKIQAYLIQVITENKTYDENGRLIVYSLLSSISSLSTDDDDALENQRNLSKIDFIMKYKNQLEWYIKKQICADNQNFRFAIEKTVVVDNSILYKNTATSLIIVLIRR